MHWEDQAPSPRTFWGALCFILNYGHFPNSTPVSEHFNQTDHSINDVLLAPLDLIRSNRDSVRKARSAHLMNNANLKLEPRGKNRRDELN